MQTKWKLLLNVPKRHYTTEEMVDKYLDINKWWWEDETNTLYQKRQEAKDALMHLVEHGEEPDDLHYAMIYVVQKFQREFLVHFRIVNEATVRRLGN